MLNSKNIKSQAQAGRCGVTAAALARNPAAHTLIGDWETHSIAVVAQLTAALRLRGRTGPQSPG